MAYTPRTWNTGDLVTGAALNALEQAAGSAAVTADIGVAGTPTGDAGRAAFAAPRDLAAVAPPASNPAVVYFVLPKGAAGQFDAGLVESPCVFFDPAVGRLAMVYAAYDKVSTDPTTVGSVGLAYSDDGLTWTKSGRIFTASGTSGAPDQYGITGPVVVVDDTGTYHLFYIGLNSAGYEGGSGDGHRTICHASAPSLSGPWTRQGTIIGSSGSGWRALDVWHPNLVFAKGQWYLFFNATSATHQERVGYATSTTLNGPWTVHDADAPLLPTTGHTTDFIWGGDPFVWREGDHWRMDFAYFNGGDQGDWWATTSDAAFPLGWQVRGRSTTGLFKPWMMRFGGRLFHYGSYNDISVYVTPDPSAAAPQTVTGAWRFNPATPTNAAASVTVGDDIGIQTGAGRAKFVVGGSGRQAELIVGQDSSHGVLFSWGTQADPATANASVETYGGSNLLTIQNNNGPVTLGGAGGTVGFFGPNTRGGKPTVTGSRGGNAALASLLTGLASLGLITDNTTA